MQWLFKKLGLFEKPEIRKFDDTTSEPQHEPVKFYTIDYDPSEERFNVLFCHGTSSALMDSILREGLVAPNLANVLESVLSCRPDLMARRADYENDMPLGPLGVGARIVEGGVFSTWLANRNGIEILAREIGNVVQHGGEVYAVTWNRLSKVISDRGEGNLPVRFPSATANVLLFRVSFDIPMVGEESPRTEHGYITELANDLANDYANPGDITEVRFVEPIPPDRIIWHGSIEQALAMIEQAPLSPRAVAKLRNL